MRTKIDWAELHAPLFLNGTNLGQKLDHKTKGGVSMEYDEDKRHLFVTYGDKTARVPETSVLTMVEAPVNIDKPARPDLYPSHRPAFDPNAAQVETPMSHVHAGPGHGQTGQEKPKAPKPKAIL